MTNDTPERRCSKCGNTFPLTSEYWHKDSGNKQGFCYTCKACARAKSRQWHQDNAEHARESSRQWYANNPDKVAEYRENNAEHIAEVKSDWRQNNPEKVKAQKQRSHVRNREHNNARSAAWYEQHKDEVTARIRERYLTDEAFAESVRERSRNWASANPERARAKAKAWYWDDPVRARAAAKAWRLANPEKAAAVNKVSKALRRAREKNAPGSFTAADIALQKIAQTDKKGILRCWWCGKPIRGPYHVDHRIAIDKDGSNDPRNLCLTHGRCNLSKGAKYSWEWNGRLL